jgi:RsiW-degrading membrane proteinase PrsW (M82 family)
MPCQIETAYRNLKNEMNKTLSEQERYFRRFLFRVSILVCVLYAVLWYALIVKWEPGDQEAIYQSYKAHRHEAEPISVVAIQ